MLSIIIPTYNEADQISTTIHAVRAADTEKNSELIIVDGGSSDHTVEIAKSLNVKVIESDKKGRAAQMNAGAMAASYPYLYFLHADSIPPEAFSTKIAEAFKYNIKSGCFRLKFDHHHWFLQANAWFTRFNVNAIRFGDQSLFVTKEVFLNAGGFKEELTIMEDQEIISRLRQHGKFKVLNNYVTTSARKYLDNGVYKMQGIFFIIWSMYYLGYSQSKMINIYKKMIRQNKL